MKREIPAKCGYNGFWLKKLINYCLLNNNNIQIIKSEVVLVTALF